MAAAWTTGAEGRPGAFFGDSASSADASSADASSAGRSADLPRNLFGEPAPSVRVGVAGGKLRFEGESCAGLGANGGGATALEGAPELEGLFCAPSSARHRGVEAESSEARVRGGLARCPGIAA